jgi:hypothetical protein
MTTNKDNSGITGSKEVTLESKDFIEYVVLYHNKILNKLIATQKSDFEYLNFILGFIELL